MRIHRLTWALLLGVLVPHAATAHDLQPGLYQIEVSVGSTASRIVNRCISKVKIERHDPFDAETHFPMFNCLKVPMCFGDGKAGFDIACVGGKKSKAKARFRYTGKSFAGEIAMTIDEDGLTTRLVERQSGRRISDCDQRQ